MLPAVNLPVIDLHCDLLSFLAENPSKTPDDPMSNSSIAQMLQGNIQTQTLAIFTKTHKTSVLDAQKQVQHLEKLLKQERKVNYFLSIENASGFCTETEPLKEGLNRLDNLISRYKSLIYIGLTWNEENRFGGGCFSSIGLKQDGKHLLEFLDKKGIAIDLSHASDYLCEDIFNYIDKRSLCVPVIASHSNCRTVQNLPRNLPDFLIKEIFHRKGLIGLNFFAPFLGKTPEHLAAHVSHLLSLGGDRGICFGADFFYDQGSDLQKRYQTPFAYFPSLLNSSCYPHALSLLQQELGLTMENLRGIAHANAQTYLDSFSFTVL